MSMSSNNNGFKIPTSIWMIGIASFLINISSGIVFSLSAVYMKTSLGVSVSWIGLLEGVVEGCAYSMKLFSGIFSDILRRRKAIMVWGFFFVALARPILALSASALAVLIARLLDRIGNGIQATPRDALVGDLSPHPIKGACYGLRQSLASTGSFFAGILGSIAMILTCGNFHYVFWLAAIPAGLALIILVTMVKDPKPTDSHHSIKSKNPLHWSDIPKLGKNYWILMGITAMFMLARVSEAMLILHAHQNFGFSEKYAPLILILYNGANALSSYPIGRLSDKVSRYQLLGLGFLTLISADLFLSLAPNISVMLIGVFLWGAQIGITQSMFMALIADLVPERLRGTAFGFFYFINAICLVSASTIGGIIAQHYGEGKTFLVSGGIAIFPFIALIIFRKFSKSEPSSLSSELPQKK